MRTPAPLPPQYPAGAHASAELWRVSCRRSQEWAIYARAHALRRRHRRLVIWTAGLAILAAVAATAALLLILS